MAVSPLTVRAEKVLYEFDVFRVDPVRRRLLRSGEQVPLTPKAFSILLVLLEYRGEVVEKEALIRRVWPDTYVTEANLTQNISALRKALRERANDHRYVVTVPGLGYSFVAEVLEIPREASGEVQVVGALSSGTVEAVPAEAPAGELLVFPTGNEALPPPAEPAATESASPIAPSPPAPVPATTSEEVVPRVLPHRGRRWFLLAGLVLGVLLAAGIGLAIFYRGRWTSVPGGEAGADPGSGVREAVAVLGLRNLSGDPKAGWLSLALSEMLITELSTNPKVRVISGEEIARLRGTLALPYAGELSEANLQKIHDLLGTDLVVVGSYLALGETETRQIRIDLRVLKAPEGDAVASLAEVGTEENLFDLITLVGRRLRGTLRWEPLSPAEEKALQALKPANREAVRLYTEGLTRLRAFDSRGARDLLRQAVDADPSSAVMHSALSLAWNGLGHDAEARKEAEKAVQLAANLPREERLAIEARFNEAKNDWRRASEIYRSLWTFYPDHPEYGLRLANSLSVAGRGAEALTTLAELRKLPEPAGTDPRIDLAEAQIAKRLTDHALQMRAARTAAAKGRQSGESQVLAEALMLQGDSLLLSGQPQAALPLYQEARNLFAAADNQGAVATSLTRVGVALHEQGDLADAEEMYQESLATLSRIGSIQGVATQLANLGLLYKNRGDMPRAQKALEEALVSYEASGDQVLRARALHGLGQVLAARGDLAGARQQFEQSLAIARRTGNRIDQARATRQLGADLARQDRLKEGLRLHEQAYELTQRVGDPVRGSSFLASSAEDLFHLGNLQEARRRLAKALEMKRRGQDKMGTAEVLGLLAQLHHRLGGLAEAERLSQEQLALARRTGSRTLIATALRDLGRWNLERGDLARARQQLEESVQIQVTNGETLEATASRLDLASLALLAGSPEEAARLASGTADWYGQRGMNGHRARAWARLCEALLAQGRTSKAWETAEQAHAISEQSEDLELQIEVITAVAPTGFAAGDQAAALGHLHWAIKEASRIGNVAAALDARFVLGILQLQTGKAIEGRTTLDEVRRDAEARGFKGLARRAAAALQIVRPVPLG